MEKKEKAYTLRPLKDRDLWPVLDIIGKVIPEDVEKTFAAVAVGDRKLEEVGAAVCMKLVSAVLKNIKQVEADVYGLLADLSCIPENEIREMPFGTTPSMIWDIVSDVKNAPFFRVLAESFSSEN